MLTHPTIDQLRALRLDGMAEAFVELQSQDVNRRWIGTPYRHPKGTPLNGEFGR